MGNGASASIAAAATTVSDNDLKAALSALSEDTKAKLLSALGTPAAAAAAPKPANPFNFTSGAFDCCTTNPDEYKVVAELPGARMVEMTLGAGKEDKKHDHPMHYMYVVQGGKLKLSPPPGATEGSAEIELKTGDAPIIPPGPQQRKNVGEAEVKIVFVEPLPTIKPCGDVKDFVSPFEVKKDCYTKLDEDEDWMIGMIEMKAGDSDPPHDHKDHLIYVLEGDQITIFPGKEVKEDGPSKVVDIKAGMALNVPAGPHHLKNSGSKDAKLVFFEMKK